VRAGTNEEIRHTVGRGFVVVVAAGAAALMSYQVLEPSLTEVERNVFVIAAAFVLVHAWLGLDGDDSRLKLGWFKRTASCASVFLLGAAVVSSELAKRLSAMSGMDLGDPLWGHVMGEMSLVLVLPVLLAGLSLLLTVPLIRKANAPARLSLSLASISIALFSGVLLSHRMITELFYALAARGGAFAPEDLLRFIP
jgi:hypothetical protein